MAVYTNWGRKRVSVCPRYGNGNCPNGNKRDDPGIVGPGWGSMVRHRSKLGPSWCVLCVLLIPGLPEPDRKERCISVREKVLQVGRRRDPRVSEMRTQKGSVSKHQCPSGAGRAALDLTQSHWFVRDAAAQMVKNRTGGLSRNGSSRRSPAAPGQGDRSWRASVSRTWRGTSAAGRVKAPTSGDS